MYHIDSCGWVLGYTTEAFDIDDRGFVVGTLHQTLPGPTPIRAFLTAGIYMGILPDLGFGAEARAINRSGQIAGLVNTPSANAAVWDPSQKFTLLKQPDDGVSSFTHGISDSGRIVGGYILPGPIEMPLYWPYSTADPIVAPVPKYLGQWAEAFLINDDTGDVAIVTSAEGIFLWDLNLNQLQPLAGIFPAAIHGKNNNIFGRASSKPAKLQLGSTIETLPGLPNRPFGIASDGNGSGEIVGTVSDTIDPEFLDAAAAPFLYRSFRRDEVVPLSGPLGSFPSYVQLAQPETVDLNSLLPSQSGWYLSKATVINAGGQIIGSGMYHGEAGAFRLSPPPLNGSGLSFVSPATVLTIVGQVAAGGGGFGITSEGHIVPIPPPNPIEITAADVSNMVRDTIRRFGANAPTVESRQMLRSALEAGIEEATRLLSELKLKR